MYDIDALNKIVVSLSERLDSIDNVLSKLPVGYVGKKQWTALETLRSSTIESMRQDINMFRIFSIDIKSIPIFTDNTTAKVGGLPIGNIYKTADGTLKQVY